MASWTDQKQRIATEQDVKAPWGGEPNGKRFRCYLCGHKFKVGDKWRWVFGGSRKIQNFIVYAVCDCENILDKMEEHIKTGEQKYWWF